MIPQGFPGRPGQHPLRIRGQPIPRLADQSAVEVEQTHERRHVHELVIVLRRELAGCCAGSHPAGDAPARLGSDRHLGGEIEPLSLRIQKHIGAVEEREIRRRPGHTGIEGVCAVVEADGDLSRTAGIDTPGIVVGLVPAQGAIASGGGEAPDEPREVVQFVRPRGPGGK